MANCEDDYFRARLSQNLWDDKGRLRSREAPRAAPARLPPRRLRHHRARRHRFRRGRAPLRARVPARLQRPRPGGGQRLPLLRQRGHRAAPLHRVPGAVRRAGLAEAHLGFFRLHIESDDEHARTLQEMTLSYAREPGWFDRCARALERALSLRASFFSSLFRRVQQRRLDGLLQRVQARRSLLPSLPEIRHRGTDGQALYDNRIDRLNIEFRVDRLPFRGEVLDARLVKIPPGQEQRAAPPRPRGGVLRARRDGPGAGGRPRVRGGGGRLRAGAALEPAPGAESAAPRRC